MGDGARVLPEVSVSEVALSWLLVGLSLGATISNANSITYKTIMKAKEKSASTPTWGTISLQLVVVLFIAHQIIQ